MPSLPGWSHDDDDEDSSEAEDEHTELGWLADALAFLLEGGEGEEGIDCMTGSLALEGWARVEGFSRAGWWTRQDAAGSRRFLSPQMEQLPGFKEVKVVMSNADYTKEQIHRFKELFWGPGRGR